MRTCGHPPPVENASARWIPGARPPAPARPRSSFACRLSGRLSTSSRNSVPPCACSSLPIRRLAAPVNAPASCPKSSLSNRLSGSAAQFSGRPSLAAGLRFIHPPQFFSETTRESPEGLSADVEGKSRDAQPHRDANPSCQPQPQERRAYNKHKGDHNPDWVTFPGQPDEGPLIPPALTPALRTRHPRLQL
jgi:hypothetical protein